MMNATESSPLATVNAVKSGVFQCTIRTDARNRDLEGQLCLIETGAQKILGRIINVDLFNPIHADPSFQPLIMDQGTLPYFSGEHADIEQCTVEVVACVGEDGSLEPRRGNPRSGTPVHSALDVSPFWREKRQHAVIGTMPGADSGLVSVINRHFADSRGGWGEAKHLGIFGRTGSGKTVLFLTLLAARMVANQHMGALLLDTKGDLASDGHFRNQESGYEFSFHDLLESGGRSFGAVTINEIALQRVEAFASLLTDWLVFHQRLGKNENIDSLVNRTLQDSLLTAKGEPRREISSATDIDFACLMNALAEHASCGWATKSNATQKADELKSYATSPGARRSFDEEVLRYFRGAYKVWDLLADVLQHGKIVMLKLGAAASQHQEFVMYELLSRLTAAAARASEQRGKNDLNSIVAIDEAHRWVPQGGKDRICQRILDALRTTRSYNVGWWLISQSMAGIENEAMRQMSTKWFCRGLDTGADVHHLENYLGSGKHVYDSLNQQGGYFSVGIGEEVNLGTGNAYQAALGFSGNATEALRRANPHIWT